MWPWLILVTAYGACVGSFLNVVVYRMPRGESLVRPPSHCPQCQQRLAWFDNVPVLAWCYLRGRCRRCDGRISIQYPMVEAATALIFGGTFAIYYLSDLRPPFIANEFGQATGLAQTWPVLLVHLVLLGALIAATLIDARLYIIPLDIPNAASATALVVLPVAAIWLEAVEDVCQPVNGPWLWAAFGGLCGLAAALGLLWAGVLPRSFDEAPENDDGEAQTPGKEQADLPADGATEVSAPAEPPASLENGGIGTPEEWLAHPHPRREVLKECLFVVWPVLGAVVGFLLADGAGGGLPLAVRVAAGVVWGYLIGATLIWAIRIIGTLGFGKEAMGLGDVHLLAAIGAVLGWQDATVVFFIAPFVGLSGTAVVAGVGKLVTGQVRVVPYGPFLAAAALVWMLFQEPLQEVYGTLFLWPQ